MHPGPVKCQIWEGQDCGCQVFADEVVLLVLVARVKISLFKAKIVVLDWKKIGCPQCVSGETLALMEKLKYLGILFMSEGRSEHKIDRLNGTASVKTQMW